MADSATLEIVLQDKSPPPAGQPVAPPSPAAPPAFSDADAARYRTLQNAKDSGAPLNAALAAELQTLAERFVASLNAAPPAASPAPTTPPIQSKLSDVAAKGMADVSDELQAAFEDARRAMERERQGRLVERARLQLDPAYRAAREQEEQDRIREQNRREQAALERRAQEERERQHREEVEAQQRRREANPVAALMDQVRGQVQAGREAEAVSRLRDAERARTDPEFANRLLRQQRGERFQAFQQSPATQAANTFGLGGVANIVGGFVSGGPVGGGLAIAGQMIQTAQQIARATMDVGRAMANLDAPGFLRGITSLVSSVPLIGGAVGSFLGFVQDLSDGLANTARRLAQYSPELAMQQAMLEVRNTFRDIERAQRLGPDLMRAVEARQHLQERVEDLITENMDVIVSVAEKGIQLLEVIVKVLDEVLKGPMGRFFLGTRGDEIRAGLDILGGIRDRMPATPEQFAQFVGELFRTPNFGRGVPAGFGQPQGGRPDVTPAPFLPALQG